MSMYMLPETGVFAITSQPTTLAPAKVVHLRVGSMQQIFTIYSTLDSVYKLLGETSCKIAQLLMT